MSMHIQLMSGQCLNEQEATEFMTQVMQGDISGVRLAAALAALRVRGETPAEIAGFARAMRQHAIQVKTKPRDVLLDVVGTGGDGANTFNISTTTAFVVAAAGVCVAKHGNRAASSRSGSADVLEVLGVNLEASPQCIQTAIDELGVGFMFARNYHPALRYAAPVRAELAARTVFNILGPLSNPAGATHLVVGVFRPELTRTLAEVLQILGTKAALVVHGNGLDELTVCGPNQTSLLRLEGSAGVEDPAGSSMRITDQVVCPEELGLNVYQRSDLTGGDAQENAQITRAILQGQGTPAQRDIVALNAGAALWVADKAPDLRAGMQLAYQVMESGAAWTLLNRYAHWTQAELGT